jgi:hypothetical protein
MTQPFDLQDDQYATGHAVYTRAAVDAYLAAVAQRRQELMTQIRIAEARAARAELAAGRVAALERSVGELVVGAAARHLNRRPVPAVPEGD